MSTHSLRALRPILGSVVREVAAGGQEAIITDNGTEIAAIIPISRLRQLDDPETMDRRVTAIRKFNEARGIHTTPEGVGSMRERLERFETHRIAARQADAA